MAENDFEMIAVSSSQVASVGYNDTTHQLRVEFVHKGSLYEYEGVPRDVFDQLVSAASVGQTFGALVKNGGYAYRRIG